MTEPSTPHGHGRRPAAPVDLLPGDEVTGTGTPAGPAHLVVRGDAVRGLPVLDEGVEVSTARVLARRPARRPPAARLLDPVPCLSLETPCVLPAPSSSP